MSLDGGIDRNYLLIGLAVLAVVFAALFFVGGGEEEEEEAPAEPTEADAFAGGYPVPPMPADGAVRGARPTATTVTSSTEEKE
jgi:NADH-quinone oxidoreductase subunit H